MGRERERGREREKEREREGGREGGRESEREREGEREKQVIPYATFLHIPMHTVSPNYRICKIIPILILARFSGKDHHTLHYIIISPRMPIFLR